MSHNIASIEVTDGPAIIPIQPYIGDTLKGVISVFKENGTTLDVSADTFIYTLYNSANNAVHTLTLGSGIELVGDGIEWRIEASDTADFVRNDKGSYTLKWIRDDNGDEKTVLAGSAIPRKFVPNT